MPDLSGLYPGQDRTADCFSLVFPGFKPLLFKFASCRYIKAAAVRTVVNLCSDTGRAVGLCTLNQVDP
jgi:hypothetical protein